LPLGDTKGDILTIYCPEIKGSDIINKGFFIMPIGEGYHRVGATFEWENKSYLPSEKAREELEKKLKSVLKCNYKIEDQQSGKRPTVGDRRPLIGEHPEIKQLYIFNGLGSKGVMLAPYYSHQLVKHIFEEEPLDVEVDIKRYLKHYGNS
jgi:glycine/D-amino acid oxidase-like deaminating enzyme